MVGTCDIFRWLIDTAAASAALLVLAYGVMLLVKQPVRRLRVGELTLVGCLLVAAAQAVPATRFSLGVVEVGQPVKLPWFDDGGATVPGPAANSTTFAAAPVSMRAKSAVREVHAGQYWRETLVGLYVVGVLLMGGRLVIGWWGLRRLKQRAVVATGESAELWRDLTKQSGRRVVLLISREVDRPITFGVWRPVVMIPREVAESARRDLLAVLRHELGHVERRDAGAWVLAASVNMLLFFLPPLWWMKREMRLSQEILADRVAADSAGGVAAYAEMMVRLVRMRQRGSRRIAARESLAVGAWLAPSDLMVRMKHLFNVQGVLERRCTRRWTLGVTVCVLLMTGGMGAVTLTDTSLATKVRATELRGVEYLLGRQEANGGWLTEIGPAPTALVVRSLLQAGVPATHGAIVRARQYVAGCRQNDGGYYTDGEPTYHTAVVLSMYAALDDVDARERVEAGKVFLEGELGQPKKTASGWYATATVGGARERSFANPGERGGDAVLETYGSLTYGRWKSLVYAGLKETDSRVWQASRWLGEHWTLDKHPGTGSAEGLFYYYLAAAKTLKAAGREKVAGHDWREEMGQRLVTGQAKDGSWVNKGSGRWLENRPEMVTAYALLALQEGRR